MLSLFLYLPANRQCICSISMCVLFDVNTEPVDDHLMLVKPDDGDWQLYQ